MHIFSYSSLDEAKKATQSALETYIYNSNKPILFLSSGGSALSLLDRYVIDMKAHQLTISVLDERFSDDPTINNFLQLQNTTFYKELMGRGGMAISTVPISSEQPELLVDRFEKALREWRMQHPDGLIIATIGMGEDGHTSGIMPFLENPLLFKQLFESTRWVVSYDADNKNLYKKRVTTTMTFLRTQVDYAVAYITGQSKLSAFQKLLTENKNIEEVPIGVLREMKLVKVFTDIKTT